MSNHRDCNFRINLGVLLVLIACSVTTFAQIEVVPCKINSEPATPPINTQRVMATLNLPFFDDFSTTPTHTPDTTFWMPNSGVYINNTLTKAQPSINVATFDGLNGEGYPYKFGFKNYQ